MLNPRNLRGLLAFGVFAFVVVISSFALRNVLPWRDRVFPGFLVYPSGIVWPHSLPGWKGWASGIEPYDIVLAYDGQKFTTAEKFYQAVSQGSEGRPVAYEIERDETRVSMTVPADRLSSLQWWGTVFCVWLVCLSALAYAFAVCLKRKCDEHGMSVFLAVASASLFGASSFEFSMGGRLQFFFLLAGQMIGPTATLFVYRFPKRRPWTTWARLLLCGVFAVGFFLFVLTQLRIEDAQRYLWVDHSVFLAAGLETVAMGILMLDAWLNPDSAVTRAYAGILIRWAGASGVFLILILVGSFVWGLHMLGLGGLAAVPIFLSMCYVLNKEHKG